VSQAKNLTQEHRESLRAIFGANEDLGRRLGSLSVSVVYDREDDTVVVTLGEPQEAVMESVRNRLYLRVDPETLKIVGIEIPHVSRRLQDDPVLTEFLRRVFPIASSEAAPAMQLAGALRDLVRP